MEPTCTEKQFLKDVANHEMIVIRDEGVNRHIRFKKPGTGIMSFDLITWPGYLCYTGDMGTYVFQRLEDMFEFFRTDRRPDPEKNLFINPSYWGEKLQAIDRTGGYREWSRERFEAQVREDLDEWIDEHNNLKSHADEIREEFELDLQGAIEFGKDSAYRFVREFDIAGALPFQGYWEVDTDEYTFRYLWCCYAIAWGVKKYDE